MSLVVACCDRTRGVDTRKAAVFNKAGNQLGELDIESLKCSVCRMLLRDAHQNIECGHRYCAPCVEIVRQRKVCPEDQEPVQEGSLRIDRGCQREIQRLFAECPGKKNGCSWRESLLCLEEHMVQCQHVEQDCQYGCGAHVTKDQWTNHAQSCLNKPVPPPRTCPYCKKKIPPSKLEEHLRKDCRRYPVMCSTDGQTEVAPGMLLANKENQYSLLHAKTSNEDHFAASLRERIAALEKEKTDINASRKKPTDLANTIPNVRYAYGGGAMCGGGLGMHSANSSGYSSGSEEDTRSRVSSLEHQVQKISSLVNYQLAGRIDTVQTMQEQHAVTMEQHAVAMEEIKLRQDILDVKKTHGIFVWKIPEITRRYGDAQARRTLSLYSPSFRTSAHGYRMCIRAYLNGDGSGKGTHISIFFVLMKSEHDNLLPWPFRHPVTFQLVNQENPSATISETFMPDASSPSFQQPKSEMNVASGFPCFAKQSVLTDAFTKGDSMFIRCKVHMNMRGSVDEIKAQICQSQSHQLVGTVQMMQESATEEAQLDAHDWSGPGSNLHH